MLVEQHVWGLEKAKARLLERSVAPYSCLDDCTVYDPGGLLAELTKAARERSENYRTPADEKSAIFHWLSSVRLKLSAAMDADDLQKLSYHSSINSWKVLEGLWALNDRPMPAAGAVWAHVPDLQNAPKDLLASPRKLFEGNPLDRAQTMLELIDWLLEREKGKV